jgi:hypothetical protein
MLGLYPLWWFLGFGAFAFIIFAVPMAVDLGRRRSLTVPRGFGFWLLFLAWTVGSLLMFRISPANTVAGSNTGRTLGIALNLASYLAATTALLYVANLPREDFSQRRLLRLLSTLFVVTVAGGLLGVVAPRFQFTAPLETLLPQSVRSNEYTQALVHPAAAQIQNVLGTELGRPAAPFGYTNFWGNNLAILLPWWIVFMWSGRSRVRKTIALAVCAAALVPVLYSLDRALWVGLVVAAAYGLVRTLHASSLARVVYVGGAIIAACVLVLTPARTIISARASHGASNAIRAFLIRASITGAEHSPVVGYGGTRKTLGSNLSIAVGPTPTCPQCGNWGIGSNGQLWLVLFAQGFVGAALYVLFFVSTLRAFIRDRAPLAIAGTLVILLMFIFMFFYIALPSALVLTMIGIGVMVRERIAPSHTSTATLAIHRVGGLEAPAERPAQAVQQTPPRKTRIAIGLSRDPGTATSQRRYPGSTSEISSAPEDRENVRVLDARAHLQSLIGQELRTTVRGRPNKILAVETKDVIVATERSPGGQPVPIDWVQNAMDILERDGEVTINPKTVKYRSAFIGAVLRTLPGTNLLPTSPPRITRKQA